MTKVMSMDHIIGITRNIWVFYKTTTSKFSKKETITMDHLVNLNVVA